MGARFQSARTKRQVPWLTLTRGNVVVALVTTIVTIGALSVGLWGGQLTGATGSSSVTTSEQAAAGEAPSLAPAGSLTPGRAGTTPDTALVRGPASTTSPAPRAGAGSLSGLDARGGPGRIVVSWRLSGSSPGQIRTTITGSDGSHPNSSCIPTATGCTFNGLANGVEYTVTASLAQGTTTADRQAARTIPYPSVLTGRTTRLWFDAADPQGLVLAGPSAAGTTVRHVLDRSSSGADAGPADGYVPPTVTMINGHTALRFGPNGGLRFPAAALPDGSAPSTVYVVAAMDSSTGELDCSAHLLLWGSEHAKGARSLIKGCGTSLAFADTNNIWPDAAATLSWHAGQLQVMRADFTASTVAVWMDGASSYVWSQPRGQQLATGSRPDGMLGASSWEVGDSWQGRIGEVIVLSAIPSPVENTAIMQYLQHKWGL